MCPVQEVRVRSCVRSTQISRDSVQIHPSAVKKRWGQQAGGGASLSFVTYTNQVRVLAHLHTHRSLLTCLSPVQLAVPSRTRRSSYYHEYHLARLWIFRRCPDDRDEHRRAFVPRARHGREFQINNPISEHGGLCRIFIPTDCAACATQGSTFADCAGVWKNPRLT